MPMKVTYGELRTSDQEVQRACKQRVYGLFFAKDSHSQFGNYDPIVIDVPILTTALEQNANSFSELLGEK